MKLTPYRVIVFATREITRGRGRKAKTERIGVGWDAWNPDHTVEPARLEGSGSFLWLGLRDAKNAVGCETLADFAVELAAEARRNEAHNADWTHLAGLVVDGVRTPRTAAAFVEGE